MLTLFKRGSIHMLAVLILAQMHHLSVQLTPPCPHGFLDSSHVLLTDKLEAKICCAGWSLLLLPELGLHQGMAHAVQQKGFSGLTRTCATSRLSCARPSPFFGMGYGTRRNK